MPSTDVSKIKDAHFKHLTTGIDSKLRQIWKQQRLSTKSRDLLKQKLNKLFIVPNIGRWNSCFRALKRVQYFIGKKAKRNERSISPFQRSISESR